MYTYIRFLFSQAGRRINHAEKGNYKDQTKLKLFLLPFIDEEMFGFDCIEGFSSGTPKLPSGAFEDSVRQTLRNFVFYSVLEKDSIVVIHALQMLSLKLSWWTILATGMSTKTRHAAMFSFVSQKVQLIW